MITIFAENNLKGKCLIETGIMLNRNTVALLFINKKGLLIRLPNFQWIKKRNQQVEEVPKS